MLKNDSYGFAATAKSSSLSSAKFPIRETWTVLCAIFLYKILVRVSCTRNLDHVSGLGVVMLRAICQSEQF